METVLPLSTSLGIMLGETFPSFTLDSWANVFDLFGGTPLHVRVIGLECVPHLCKV